MSYSILLVDDEMPALRFMQAIIEKHLPEYFVTEKVTSGAQGLTYLQNNPVDLLITDISMPGMDGITLAKQARALLPEIHIIIVSGYAEFDYARGALNVSADDYLLKPLNIPNAIRSLKEVAQKLESEYNIRQKETICKLACSKTPMVPKNLLSRPHCFALIRWGNLHSNQPIRLITTRIIPAPNYPFTVLLGIDENERIVVSDQSFGEFYSDFLAFAKHENPLSYTVVLTRIPLPLSSLRCFVEKATDRIDNCLIIGRQQLLYYDDSNPIPAPLNNPGMILRKIEQFAAIGNMKMVKETFVNIAAEWEKRQYTQQQISNIVYSIVQQVILATPALIIKQELVFRNTAELLQYSSSYGSLMAGLYDMLFNDNDFHDKNMSPKEMCEYIMAYIRQNFAKPLSVQSICTEIGISQSYVSRLLRNFGNISFSAYLTQCRIDAAMSLIRQHPDILLRDVAACVGYDDPFYFSKVFHQTTNKTPTQFATEIERNIT